LAAAYCDSCCCCWFCTAAVLPLYCRQEYLLRGAVHRVQDTLIRAVVGASPQVSSRPQVDQLQPTVTLTGNDVKGLDIPAVQPPTPARSAGSSQHPVIHAQTHWQAAHHTPGEAAVLPGVNTQSWPALITALLIIPC
jgi:hypothetical protein